MSRHCPTLGVLRQPNPLPQFAEPSSVAVVTFTVGTKVAPAPASTGGYRGDGQGVSAYTAMPATPPVPPVALPTPSAVAAQTRGTRTSAKSRVPNPPAKPRTSNEEMDFGLLLPAMQHKKWPSMSKPAESPKKPPSKVQALKNKT